MARETLMFEAAAVWLDGTSLVGSVKEIELPELTWDTVDYEAIALRGTSQFARAMEPMECTIQFADYNRELAAAAANPYKAVTLQVRGAYGAYRAGSKVRTADSIITLRGRFMSSQLGTLTQGEMERECMMAVDYVKEVSEGQLISEFSVNPPIWNAGGVDVFSTLRSILGI